MTYTEEYQEHIKYTFHAFCKVVIRNAMLTALRTRSRKNKREISVKHPIPGSESVLLADVTVNEQSNLLWQVQGI